MKIVFKICFFNISLKPNTTNDANLSYFVQKFESSDINSANSTIEHENSNFLFDFPDKSKTSLAVQRLKDGVNTFHASLLLLNINQKQSECIYKMVKTLAQAALELVVASNEENSDVPVNHIVEQTTDMLFDQLDKRNTKHKQNMQCEKMDLFVKPKELAVGLRYERKKNRKNGKTVCVVREIQNTFQFVSIVGTLESLFKETIFEEYYFKYNSSPNHDCDQAKLSDFCCGSTFKNNPFFRENPNCLKIQIYADEFELCNPLQSKSGIHKTWGIYFTIRNLPKDFSSKLNNILLVALVNANDLKSKETDFNNIWHPIIKDLKYLESHGIQTKTHGIIKGTLTHLSFDNLGANLALGFASSFSATNYCRFCLLSKTECQKATSIDQLSRRTKDDYNHQIQLIENSEKVKYSETKGVKIYCDLNDLKHFHIIDNPTCDVLHDFNEGVLPFTLKFFFEFCLSIKLFSLDQLRFMFQFHDYGWLNRKNIPSQIKLDARSLGQNGSQSLCLFRFFPFVLYQFKEEPRLKSHWIYIQLLLKILVIVYSYEIYEETLNELESIIKNFLACMTSTFNVDLIPKLHFLLHYVAIIRMVGPVIYMSTIRYEAKHQVFKHMAQNTKNFKNITKSLAFKHQQRLCQIGVSCAHEIHCQKPRPISNETIAQHGEVLSTFEQNVKLFMYTESLSCNNYEYRNGFLFIHDSSLHKIYKILCIDNKYIFLCKKCEVIHFDDFLNSFEVNENITFPFNLINFTDLDNKRPYEIKFHLGKEYVIEEDLEFRYKLNL